MRLRSVVVGPLELEDLQNDIVNDMATKSEEFFYRFHYIEKEEKHVGCVVRPDLNWSLINMVPTVQEKHGK